MVPKKEPEAGKMFFSEPIMFMKVEGVPFDQIEKKSEKSRIAEKKRRFFSQFCENSHQFDRTKNEQRGNL